MELQPRPRQADIETIEIQEAKKEKPRKRYLTKRRKRILRRMITLSLVVGCITFVLVYLASSFSNLEFDFREWKSYSRTMVIMLTFFSSAISLIVGHIMFDSAEDK